MPLPIRIEYRVTLSDVERGVDASAQLIVGQDPEETNEHLTLRVLAWCLLYDPDLEFGPGVTDPDGADLWSHDLTGRVATWIDCGATSAEKLKRVVRHRRGARVHVLLDDAGERERLLAELVRARVAGVRVWLVDAALVRALASHDER
ncbi:MAG TPA: YaeQ family protein, partial [Polyangia bacterium]|nr:YaeQ family protein [Polyangia bacterium]